MARLDIPTPENISPEAKPVLDQVEKSLGFVPNGMRLLSLSPTVLGAFVALQGTLGKTLDAKTRHAVSLAVSGANACDYCCAMHGFISNVMGKNGPEEIALNLQGKSANPKTAVATAFARSLIETRGKVADSDLEAVRGVGYGDREIVEIIALTAQVLMTNFMNNVAETEIDLPGVKAAA